MEDLAVVPADSGLEVIDLQSDLSFNKRPLRVRDFATQIEGMDRLARVFVERPDTILQELVDLAVELCGADSAGISMVRQEEKRSEDGYYESGLQRLETMRTFSMPCCRAPRAPVACAWNVAGRNSSEWLNPSLT